MPSRTICHPNNTYYYDAGSLIKGVQKAHARRKQNPMNTPIIFTLPIYMINSNLSSYVKRSNDVKLVSLV